MLSVFVFSAVFFPLFAFVHSRKVKSLKTFCYLSSSIQAHRNEITFAIRFLIYSFVTGEIIFSLFPSYLEVNVPRFDRSVVDASVAAGAWERLVEHIESFVARLMLVRLLMDRVRVL